MSVTASKTFEKIIKDIESKKFCPVYFLKGEEPYYIDKITECIEKNVLNESEKSFNQSVLYGKDTDTLSISMAARRFPMMANHQVIIIKEAQMLKDLNGMESYLEKPVPSTILVFCFKSKALDKRTKISKLLQNYVFFESEKIKDKQIPSWVEGYLGSKGFTIEPRASMLTGEFLGNDLSRIANELDKLIVNLKDKRLVSPKDIEENIGISKEYNVFELQNAIGARDFQKAMKIINFFASDPKKTPLVVLISNLYNYFSKIYAIHYLKDRSKKSIAENTGINPYFVDDYLGALKNYHVNKIEHIFDNLKTYDLKSKGVEDTGTEDGELMKELITRIFN